MRERCQFQSVYTRILANRSNVPKIKLDQTVLQHIMYPIFVQFFSVDIGFQTTNNPVTIPFQENGRQKCVCPNETRGLLERSS